MQNLDSEEIIDRGNLSEEEDRFKENIEMPKSIYSKLGDKKLVANIETDSEGTILSMSDVAKVWLLPLKTQSWIGKSLKTIFLPPFHAKVDGLLNAVKSQGKKFAITEFLLLGNERCIISGSLLSIALDKTSLERISFNLVNLSSSIKRFSEIQDYQILFDEAQRLSKTSYWFYSEKERVTRWADGMYKIFELPLDFDPNKVNVLDKLLHPEDANRVREALEQNFVTKEPLFIEYRLLFDNNMVKWVSMNVEHICDELGEYKAIGTIQDRTEQRSIRKEKLIENGIYGNLFEAVTDIFVIFEQISDSDGIPVDYRYKMVNSSFERKFSLPRQNVIGTCLSEHLPSVFQQLYPKFKIFSLSKQPSQDQIYLDTFDEFYDILVYSPAENLLAVLWRDVSLSVKAGISLRASEEKYRQLFNVSTNALFLVDLSSGKIIDRNMSAQKLMSNVPNSSNSDFADLLFDPTILTDAISEGQTILSGIGMKGDSEGPIPSDLFFTYFNWSGRKVYLVSVMNVSDRVEQSDALVYKEQKYRAIYEQSPDAVLMISNYRIVDVNDKALELFRLTSSAELIDKPIWGISANQQPSGENARIFAVEQIQNAMLGATILLDWVFQIGQTLFYTEIKMKSVANVADKMLMLIVRDMSMVRDKENKLEQTIERYRLAMEDGSFGIWDFDTKLDSSYLSPEVGRILGYEEVDFPTKFEDILRYVHPDDAQALLEKVSTFTKSKSPFFATDIRMRCKNGSYKWISLRGRTVHSSEENQLVRFVGVSADVTKFKVREIECSRMNKNKDKALELGRLGFWELDLRTMTFSGPMITFEMFDLVGVETANLKSIENAVHPEDRELFMGLFLSKKVVPNSQAYFRILNKDGIRFIQSKLEPIYDSQMTLTGYSGVFQDISLFKTEELFLRNKELTLNAIQSNTSLGIYIVQEGHLLFSTSAIMDLTGFSISDFRDEEFDHFTIYEESQRPMIRDLFQEGMSGRNRNETITVPINNVYNRSKWADLQISKIIIGSAEAFLVTLIDVSERYKEEIRLKAQNAYFEKILEFIEDGVIVTDSSKNILFANQGMCDISRYTKAEICKEKLSSLIAFPQEDQDLEHVYGEIRKSGISICPDLQIIVKDGDLVWANMKATYLRSEDGTENSFLFYIKNNDVQKKAVDEAKNIREILTSIVEESPYAVALFNSDSKLVFSNGSYNSLFSLDPESQTDQYELLRNSIMGIRPFSENLPGERQSLEYNMSDGRCFLVRVTPVKSSQETYVFVEMGDHTLQTRKELELRETITHYTSMHDSFAFGLVTIGKKREIIYCNSVSQNILGRNEDALLGKKVETLFPVSNYDNIITQYNSLLAGMIKNFGFEAEIAESRNKKWIYASLSPVTDRFGDVELCVVTIWDITNRKSRELRKQDEQRRLALKKVGESFAPILSKQLSVMQVDVGVLKAVGDFSERTSSYLDIMSNRLVESKDLLEDFESISGLNRMIRYNIDINRTLESVVMRELKGKEIPLSKKYGVLQPITNGDPKLLDRAFTYLIRYLVRQTYFAQGILIETDVIYYESDFFVDEETVIKSGRYIQISMSRGELLNKEINQSIFDPFAVESQQKENLDFDLRMAFNIIKNHKGMILATSSKDNGLSFNVFLPHHGEDHKYTDSAASCENLQSNRGRFNVLLVDDEDLSRDITASLLCQLDCSVYSFGSKDTAMAFYSNNYSNIDFVLIDSDISGTRGSELFKAMEKLKPSVVAALMVLDKTAPLDADFAECGFVKVVGKPVGFETLASLLLPLVDDQAKI